MTGKIIKFRDPQSDVVQIKIRQVSVNLSFMDRLDRVKNSVNRIDELIQELKRMDGNDDSQRIP